MQKNLQPQIRAKKSAQKIQESIKSILQILDNNPTREGLIDTPKRVYQSYLELFSGYSQDPEELLKEALFKTVNQNMVIIKNIDFFSTCEHHMLPIIGKVSVGYLPNKKVVGLSKIPRLVDLFAKRLQIQENMTSQIASSLMKNINAKGVGVVVEARHLCMEARGVCKIGSITKTFAYEGNFKNTNNKKDFLEQIK